jgi:hypothetical protein
MAEESTRVFGDIILKALKEGETQRLLAAESGSMLPVVSG